MSNKKKKKKRGKKHPGRNKHHLRPKSRGGKKQPFNILLIDVERHHYWHRLFGNRTLDEIIKLLQRIRRIKFAQKRRA